MSEQATPVTTTESIGEKQQALLATRLLSSRYHTLSKPVLPLNQSQVAALQNFRRHLADGVYKLEDAPCLCGAHESRLVARRDRYALPVTTHICRSCGLLWTSPRMTEESLAVFYETDYRPIYVGAEEAPEDFFAAQIRKGRRVYAFISSHHASVASGNPTVFDVGCGAGGLLVPFVEAGWRAFGCDLGEQYLARGRAAGLQLEQGDIGVLEKHGPADLVILSHVLEHLSDPKRSLQQVSSVTTDNAYLYVEVPGVLSIHKQYRDLLRFLQNAHLYHFNLWSLAALMAQAGFTLLEGNENVEALFRKTSSVNKTDTSDQYHKITRYLALLEIGRVTRFWEAARLAGLAKLWLLHRFRRGFRG